MTGHPSRGATTSRRSPRRRPQLSSRWLAASLVVAYAAVAAAVGVVLLAVPRTTEADGQGMPTYIYRDSPQSPAATGQPVPGGPDPARTSRPTKVAQPLPEGARRVSGPNGLVTVIPEGWVVTRSTGPGAVQATDPDDPARFLRYGGSPAPATDILTSHVDYEARFSAAHPGFTRLSLGTAPYRGVTAVDWEFEHDSDTGRRHARSLYWRVDGVEYFLYAASSADRWTETSPIFLQMVNNTTP